MNKAKFQYLMGSFFFLVAVLLLTVIPHILNMTELLFIPENGDFVLLSICCVTIANFFYLSNYEYYKKQVVWICFLLSFYIFYQMISILAL